MSKLVAILRTGTFVDSKGKEHTFTEADLDTIVCRRDLKRAEYGNGGTEYGKNGSHQCTAMH
ncbi:MAG: hypothetical protein M1510_11675, partial [Nitrospirae bacterium]|nr:hypothetical protein [Nitrospirota bacterium]